jgi:hypothetical protein
LSGRVDANRWAGRWLVERIDGYISESVDGRIDGLYIHILGPIEYRIVQKEVYTFNNLFYKNC